MADNVHAPYLRVAHGSQAEAHKIHRARPFFSQASRALERLINSAPRTSGLGLPTPDVELRYRLRDDADFRCRCKQRTHNCGSLAHYSSLAYLCVGHCRPIYIYPRHCFIGTSCFSDAALTLDHSDFPSTSPLHETHRSQCDSLKIHGRQRPASRATCRPCRRRTSRCLVCLATSSRRLCPS